MDARQGSGVVSLARDLVEGRSQIVCSVTADPVQMHQQASGVLALKGLTPD